MFNKKVKLSLVVALASCLMACGNSNQASSSQSETGVIECQGNNLSYKSKQLTSSILVEAVVEGQLNRQESFHGQPSANNGVIEVETYAGDLYKFEPTYAPDAYLQNGVKVIKNGVELENALNCSVYL